MDSFTPFFGSVNEHLALFFQKERYSQLVVLVDENTATLCLPLLKLPEHFLIQIESGEKHKNIQTCQNIWAQLLDKGIDRQAILLNLGGGVIGDMGGFCASCFKRGIRFINIPTTLLAMVDASIGAKTGVDFMNQKNMIGLFSNPRAVIIDPIFLNTLEARQIRSGKAEMLKHGIIANENHFEDCIEVDLPSLELIKDSIRIKERIVDQDPLEQGIRKALNFGHTLGHAIESAALSEGKNVLHGEAVAHGMILELLLSALYADLDQAFVNHATKRLVQLYGTPKFDSASLNNLIDLCFNDKKNENQGINFSLISSPGEVKININLSREEILRISV